jgi:signal transduction histidine kinase
MYILHKYFIVYFYRLKTGYHKNIRIVPKKNPGYNLPMADKSESITFHAPPEKARRDVLEAQAQEFQGDKIINTIGDALPNSLLILNTFRQIIYANKTLLEFLGLTEWKEVKGKRPGEVFGCIHSSQLPGGCGTTEFCRTCGAVNAILESQKGVQSIQECRISSYDVGALDLRVWATPFYKEGELFTIFAAADISSEKRREALERTFFHDVLNTASGITGLSEVMRMEENPLESRELLEMIHNSSKQLIEEIQSQRQLGQAERGQLEISKEHIDCREILNDVKSTYSNHNVSEKKHLVIGETMPGGGSNGTTVFTDPVLLRRVLGNMVKNALEATSKGGTVTITAVQSGDTVVFKVHNPKAIPRNIQLQLFQRSFSTKGNGRGIGTYSIKLLGESYLGGEVGFESSEENGTIFFIKLPTIQL